jgi:hypothetical protein
MDDCVPMDETIDGAAADRSVSADAMRWSPRRARARAEFPGVDCGTGLPEALRPYVRRLVSRAVTPLRRRPPATT